MSSFSTVTHDGDHRKAGSKQGSTKKPKGASKTIDIRNNFGSMPMNSASTESSHDTRLKCGRCGGGPLILMSSNNERLYSEAEYNSMMHEY